MRVQVSAKKLRVLVAVAAVLLTATQVAEAGCQYWNGCMRRTAKRLEEFRAISSTFIDLSQKCIDALNVEQSNVALKYSACMDAATDRHKMLEILDDGDVQEHLSADDKALRDQTVKNSDTIMKLAEQYETPSERDARRQAAEQRLADARAQESHSEAWHAAVIGALADGAQGAANAANQQAARPSSYTCFTQAAPGGGGASTMCLPH